MTPQELKTSILQLAIRGKLVEQRPEEGNGEELFQKIQKEKETLIKAKKIKKTKNLPDISEDEIPFDIPNSWKWMRVDGAGSWGAGATPPRTNPDYYDGTIPWLKTGDLNDGYIRSVPEAISEVALKTTSVRLNPPGSVLIAMYGATIGKLGIADIALTTNQACCACIPFNGVLNLYLFYFLMAMRDSFKRMSEGGAQPNISKEKIVMSLIPLPPLAEQKRIVERIEELMPLVDQYEVVWNRLEELNKQFPIELQKSILQLAIQGRLVEQRPVEGTGEELYQIIQKEKRSLIKAGTIKKDKILPPVEEVDVLFDIPDSWKWAYIGDLFQHNTGKALNSSDKTGRPLEYITTSNVYWNRFILDDLKTMLFTDSEIEKCTVKKGDLLVLEGGDVGRAAIWHYDYPMRIQNHIHKLRPYSEINISFFYYVFFFLKSLGVINGKGIGIKGLSAKVLHSLIVPLPPLAEQKRIVNKIEELLPYCEALQ